jgi:hypothetical protein
MAAFARGQPIFVWSAGFNPHRNKTRIACYSGKKKTADVAISSFLWSAGFNPHCKILKILFIRVKTQMKKNRMFFLFSFGLKPELQLAHHNHTFHFLTFTIYF